MENNQFDIIVIGGGATGLGVAVEAASRGYKTLLLEGNDYGSGTSSKSTKLVHGGVRYLANLDIELVQEGLEERFYFLQNTPHIAKLQNYLIPFKSQIEKIKYWIGLKLYDFLAGSRSLGKSKFLNQAKTFKAAPDLPKDKICGGAIYQDGQFDDSRMLITLLKTFEELGGIAYNYNEVTKFNHTNENKIKGVSVYDKIFATNKNFYAPIVINATGTLSDRLRDMAEPESPHHNILLAQGTHLVFDKEIFNSEYAILVPETSDGRVLFILPWLDKIVVGTTDIAVDKSELEPIAQVEEINFILETLNRYSKRQINYQDIRSVFCGQRPLVKPLGSKDTSKISRKHEIFTSGNGLVTIVGGKWTIYRLMGEETINHLEKHFNLPATKSRTKQLKLFGYSNNPAEYPLSSYGSEANKIQDIQIETGNFAKLHPRLPYFQAELIYQIRYEQAKTIEDILARRTRALLLDANAAVESAELVASILASELGKDSDWQQEQLKKFKQFSQSYSVGYYNK